MIAEIKDVVIICCFVLVSYFAIRVIIKIERDIKRKTDKEDLGNVDGDEWKMR